MQSEFEFSNSLQSQEMNEVKGLCLITGTCSKEGAVEMNLMKSLKVNEVSAF